MVRSHFEVGGEDLRYGG